MAGSVRSLLCRGLSLGRALSGHAGRSCGKSAFLPLLTEVVVCSLPLVRGHVQVGLTRAFLSELFDICLARAKERWRSLSTGGSEVENEGTALPHPAVTHGSSTHQLQCAFMAKGLLENKNGMEITFRRTRTPQFLRGFVSPAHTQPVASD